MRALAALLIHALLATLFLVAGPALAQPHDHGAPHAVMARMSTDLVTTHVACGTHRLTANAMAAHGSTARCKQACLALSAGFSAVLQVQVHALWLGDGASPRPDARPALPTGRVVMPERRPPRSA